MTTPTEQSIRKACEEAGVPYLSFLSYRPGDYLKNAIVELARRIEAEAVPVAGLYGVPKLSSGSVKAGDAGQLFNAATPQPDRVAELEARIEEVNHYHKKRLGTYKAALEMLNEATARAEAAEAELERRKYDTMHTCHAECQREACVLRREVDALRAERDAVLAEGVALGIDAAVQWAKDDAKICDCSAHSEGECACGAWCEWKTVPMVRVAQNLAELDPAAIIAQHRRAQALSDLIAGDADLYCGTLGDSDGDDGA